MNIAQCISHRTHHVLCGTLCVVAVIALSGSGFVTYIPSGFWRTSAVLALASSFAYGVYRAVMQDSDSFVEMGARFASFVILTLFLYAGVYTAL